MASIPCGQGALKLFCDVAQHRTTIRPSVHTIGRGGGVDGSTLPPATSNQIQQAQVQWLQFPTGIEIRFSHSRHAGLAVHIRQFGSDNRRFINSGGIIGSRLVGSTGGVPRAQKMLNGPLPRFIYHQVY